MKVFSNSNYIIRKLGTYRTQYVHRMQLRTFTPNCPLEDVVDDPSRHPGDPEPNDDQAFLKNNLPHKNTNERPTLTTQEEQAEPEVIARDHVIIYYDRQHLYQQPARDTRLLESPPMVVPQPSDDPIPPSVEPFDDPIVPPTKEHQVPTTTTKQHSIQFENPTSCTYQDLLVHELQIKPALMKFMQRKSSST